jgi:hypothetical protein
MAGNEKMGNHFPLILQDDLQACIRYVELAGPGKKSSRAIILNHRLFKTTCLIIFRIFDERLHLRILACDFAIQHYASSTLIDNVRSPSTPTLTKFNSSVSLIYSLLYVRHKDYYSLYVCWYILLLS